jgi:glycyl-tRNA synthetase
MNIFEIDPAIIMNPKVWVATGHVANFHDPLVDCKHCHGRFRADKLIKANRPDLDTDGMSVDEMDKLIQSGTIKCPDCGESVFTPIRQFQMMFKTNVGVTEDASSVAYLRPETAQGLFVNFKNVQRTQRAKLPFGICDIGKAFRNEITPGNFTFRTREFEQMEIEYFFKPGEDAQWFDYWKKECLEFVNKIGLKADWLRFRDHEANELAFYSKGTTDIEYYFPSLGWGELMGIASRTDYDLTRHQTASTQDLTYLDPETNQRYIPHVVEPSFGCDRLLLALFCDAYDEETVNGETRIVLRLNKHIAPYQVAILPLSNKLNEEAKKAVWGIVADDFDAIFDTTGSIGKRYRREDEIGTPYCVTYDFDSAADQSVTVRDRDTMVQERIKIADLKAYLMKKLAE